MNHESSETTRLDIFSHTEDTHRWYLKENVVKEEEYSREYCGRCLASRARSRCQRSRDEVSVALGLQKKLFRLSQSDSDTRSSSLISRGHSAGAPCKMGFSTCARAAIIRRKCILEIAATTGVPHFFSVFFLLKRETRSLPSLASQLLLACWAWFISVTKKVESTYGKSIRDVHTTICFRSWFYMNVETI